MLKLKKKIEQHTPSIRKEKEKEMKLINRKKICQQRVTFRKTDDSTRKSAEIWKKKWTKFKSLNKYFNDK